MYAYLLHCVHSTFTTWTMIGMPIVTYAAITIPLISYHTVIGCEIHCVLPVAIRKYTETCNGMITKDITNLIVFEIQNSFH